MNTWLVTGLCILMLGATVLIGMSVQQDANRGSPIPIKQVEVKDVGVVMSFVSGTEYKPGQIGQVIVEARYPNGTSVINGTNCLASVWNPDKTSFITNQTMNASDSNGNAFIEFIVPDVDGVFEYQSVCEVNGKSYTASHSFHVTKPRIYAVIPK